LRLIALAVVVVAAFLGLAASPAFAARGHVYLGEEPIGEPCPALEIPCGEGKLKEPSGVAVDEATNEVYVIDQGNNRIELFNAATSAFVREFDGSATPAGSFAFGSQPANGAIAVDNDPTSPSFKDVYVADLENRVVDKFGPTGEYLGQITAAGEVPFQSEPLEAVTVDAQGSVWVYRAEVESVIDHFTNDATNKFVSPEVHVVGTGNFANSGLAIDSAGNFYVRHTFHEDPVGRVTKVDPEGKLLIEEVDGESTSAVAVELGTDAVFLDNLTSVAAYSPAGVELERFDFSGALTEGGGIGLDAASGFAYVADRAAGHIVLLGPEPPRAPTVEPRTQSVLEVTSTSALLQAEVNPRGAETEYFFEYGPCATPATCATSPFGHTTPAGTLPADFAVHAATATASGLEPNTTYHYRLVAANVHGSAEGEQSGGAEVLHTFTTQTAEPFALPDSREWELVSPADKLGARILPITETGVIQAAVDGSALTYLTATPTEAEPQGNSNEVQVLSTRTAAGWSSRDIAIPHTAATGSSVGAGQEYKFFNPLLTLGAVQPFGAFNPGLSPEASESTAFLHDLGTSCAAACYRPLVTGKPGFANVTPEGVRFGEDEKCEAKPTGNTISACGPGFLGANEDLSHVVLHSTVPLLEGAGEDQLYEWSGGHLAQISVLPEGGLAPTNTHLGLENVAVRGAISTDGSRIDWSTNAGLYQRDMPRGETVQLDAAEPACLAALECSSGGGQFQIASADGSRVFFTDSHRLTADSGAAEGKADLYECQISAGDPACDLTDLTPEVGTEIAAVQGSVLGASQDGSSVYFVANGVLAANVVDNGAGPERAEPGSCAPASSSGTCNLYRRQGATTTFITQLAGGDYQDWDKAPANQPTRVSGSGRFLALMSERSLTGYDNRDLATGIPAAEVFLYDAVASRLHCVSCDPSGSLPVGVEQGKLEVGGGIVGSSQAWPGRSLVAANVPGWTAIDHQNGTKARHQPRYLADSGRLFFNTLNALGPADSNGTWDVYQYEPPGVGGCTISSPTFDQASGGCVGLISAGTSGDDSAFLDASESGDDVFFITRSKLVLQDEDAALDVYDAHACPDGAAVPCLPSPPPPAPACEGDACQPPATPPVDATPGSLTFNGAGNVLECPKGKVKKNGKCVAKKHKAKKHKKDKKHAKKRPASHNRGGGK
jgi:DNA-binding beta-propeller fold protein YncE